MSSLRHELRHVTYPTRRRNAIKNMTPFAWRLSICVLVILFVVVIIVVCIIVCLFVCFFAAAVFRIVDVIGDGADDDSGDLRYFR